MSLTAVFLHITLAVSGLLLGVFGPPGWQLPIFFAAVALTVAAVIAAHTYPNPKTRSRAGAAALFVASLLLVGPGGQIHRGRGSLYFTLAFLFTLAFVGGLALARYAA